MFALGDGQLPHFLHSFAPRSQCRNFFITNLWEQTLNAKYWHIKGAMQIVF